MTGQILILMTITIMMTMIMNGRKMFKFNFLPNLYMNVIWFDLNVAGKLNSVIPLKSSNLIYIMAEASNHAKF